MQVTSTGCRVAVIGASGFVGSHVYSACQSYFGESGVIGTCFRGGDVTRHVQLDATDKTAVAQFVTGYKPQAVVVCAGNKNIAACEASWDEACAGNVAAVVNLLAALHEDVDLLVLSSDYVFSGTRGNYTDTQETSPVTNYGKSKALAEQLMRESGKGTAIRTSAVIGSGSVFWNWLSTSLVSKKPIEMFTDAYFSPTPIALLSDLIIALLERPGNTSDHFELLHAVGPQRLSRYDFAVLCAELLGIAGANIEAVQRDKDSSLPADISLRPSAFAVNNMKTDFHEYLLKSIR